MRIEWVNNIEKVLKQCLEHIEYSVNVNYHFSKYYYYLWQVLSVTLFSWLLRPMCFLGLAESGLCQACLFYQSEAKGQVYSLLDTSSTEAQYLRSWMSAMEFASSGGTYSSLAKRSLFLGWEWVMTTGSHPLSPSLPAGSEVTQKSLNQAVEEEPLAL